jgi:hypothetical protein
MTDTEKQPPDWERIEAEFRGGLRTLRQIASDHDLTEGAIRKRAKRDGWERDLGPKIRAKADALVRREEVRNSVRKDDGAYSEKEIIESEALRVASVGLTQRKDVARARNLCMQLFAELEAQTNEPELFCQLGEFLREEGEEGARKRAAAYDKVLSFGSRLDGMKKLGETLKVLIGLERDIYGLNNPEPPPPPAPANAQGATVVSDDPNAAAAAYRALMN